MLPVKQMTGYEIPAAPFGALLNYLSGAIDDTDRDPTVNMPLPPRGPSLIAGRILPQSWAVALLALIAPALVCKAVGQIIGF